MSAYVIVNELMRRSGARTVDEICAAAKALSLLQAQDILVSALRR